MNDINYTAEARAHDLAMHYLKSHNEKLTQEELLAKYKKVFKNFLADLRIPIGRVTL